MEGVAEGSSPPGEGLDDTGAIGVVVVVDTEVGVGGVGAEDGVEDAGELVGGGGDGFGGDDVLKLDIHEGEGVLHVEDVASGLMDEPCPLADERAKEDDLVVRAESRSEQADGVQVLDPLAITDVALEARNLLERAGIDKEDFEAAAFEEVEERDPEAFGGLHGDGCDSASSEPVGEASRSAVKAGKERTGWASTSGETATKCSVAPMSMPAACG